MNREAVIEQHSKLCAYIGAGSKKRRRNPDAPHHNRGAYKYESENQRIRQCAVSLFNWCNNIGVPVVADWNQLTKEQRPKNGGRCATL